MSTQPRYWQVAAGALGHEYSEDFLAFGLAFFGKDEKKLAALRQIAVGDRMVLKSGKTHIVAVGKVVERDGKHCGVDDKAWLRDLDGWDLGAYCYVDWRMLPKPEKAEGLAFGAINATRRQKLQARADEVLGLPEPEPCYWRPDPPPTEPVADDEILSFLVRQGLRPSAAEDLTAVFGRIRLLARYYYESCQRAEVREHETRTFLVVPLLLALGWAEQQLKIELPTGHGGRIDIACFDKACSSGQRVNCKLIVETKGFNQGLDYAADKVKWYAKRFPECNVLLVTNGYCYKAFTRKAKSEFSDGPVAYLNLLDPRSRYPKDPENTDGCLEALRLLLPSL
jgi:hypothetical protein